jgi:hypothetical protein
VGNVTVTAASNATVAAAVVSAAATVGSPTLATGSTATAGTVTTTVEVPAVIVLVGDGLVGRPTIRVVSLSATTVSHVTTFTTTAGQILDEDGGAILDESDDPILDESQRLGQIATIAPVSLSAATVTHIPPPDSTVQLVSASSTTVREIA